jgi:hypothetical protein
MASIFANIVSKSRTFGTDFFKDFNIAIRIFFTGMKTLTQSL